MEEEDRHKISDLIKELVLRLVSPDPTSDSRSQNPNSSDYQTSLRYAVRILSSRMTPSIAPDVAAIAESIKRQLATQGKSSQALTFADLYTKFASKNGLGSVNNKWAVIYLLKIMSNDRKSMKNQLDSCMLLPKLVMNDPGFRKNPEVLHSRKNGEEWNSGILVVAKDPGNFPNIAFRKFVYLVKEENEPGDDLTDCAMGFLYFLCSINIRTNLRKF